ncbi:MAG: hypothetical protein ACRDPC_19640 [Solirubrobacteraceae bacterium]
MTVIADEPGTPGAAVPGRDARPAGADAGTARRAEPQAPRGPLLAVCGLCGGAGASTLAYLLAVSATRRRSDPVLVCDTGGPTGGLAGYAGVATPRSLAEVAEHVAAGLPPGRLYASTADGVRVLATGPRFTPGCVRDGVELVLEHARGAHALTVVDCGTLTREAEQIALTKATHVAWVLPATPSGARRGERVLDAVNPYLLGRELVVARRDEQQPKAALRELKRLAEARNATLILVPHVPDVAAGEADEALSAAQVPLQAIHGVLER